MSHIVVFAGSDYGGVLAEYEAYREGRTEEASKSFDGDPLKLFDCGGLAPPLSGAPIHASSGTVSVIVAQFAGEP